MTDDAFRDAIIDQPADPLHCLAYADWLDELGRADLAFALRWMARTGRRPARRRYYRGLDAAPGYAVPEKYSWCWYREPFGGNARARAGRRRERNPEVPLTCELPSWLMSTPGGGAPHHFFPSWRAAVDWLASSLALVRDGLEAWSPPD